MGRALFKRATLLLRGTPLLIDFRKQVFIGCFCKLVFLGNRRGFDPLLKFIKKKKV